MHFRWLHNAFQFFDNRYIVVVKKTFRYSNVFSYNHLYQPECFYEKRYNILSTKKK